MRWLALALVPALILGCKVRAPIEGRQDQYGAPQVAFATNDLRKRTAVDAPRLSRDDAGILFVSVPVRSAVNQTLVVDYRFTFFDRAGGVINQTGWSTVRLQSNTPQMISGNSMNAQAADFQLDLRYAK